MRASARTGGATPPSGATVPPNGSRSSDWTTRGRGATTPCIPAATVGKWRPIPNRRLGGRRGGPEPVPSKTGHQSRGRPARIASFPTTEEKPVSDLDSTERPFEITTRRDGDAAFVVLSGELD